MSLETKNYSEIFELNLNKARLLVRGDELIEEKEKSRVFQSMIKLKHFLSYILQWILPKIVHVPLRKIYRNLLIPSLIKIIR